MIVDSQEKTAVSQGVNSKSSFLIIDLKTEQIKSTIVSKADRIGLKKLDQDRFLVKQYLYPSGLIFSIHSLNQPKEKLTSMTLDQKGFRFEGQMDLWQTVPQYFVEFFLNDFKLIKIDAKAQTVDILPLEWYEEFDKKLVGIRDVYPVSETQELIFSILRKSLLVVFNLKEKRVTKKISLSSTNGSPFLHSRTEARELWVADQDHMVKLAFPKLDILAKETLEGASGGKLGQNIGEFSFNADQSYCTVSRPLTQDAVLMDCNHFKIVGQATCDGPPFDIAALENRRFVYREWKSDKIGFGKFKSVL